VNSKPDNLCFSTFKFSFFLSFDKAGYYPHIIVICCRNSKLSATFPVPAISPKVAHQFYDSIRGKTFNKTKVIVSSHNYQQTPSVEDLGNLVARIQATGADIVKIATTAVEITDVARMFQIMVHSQVRHVCLIVQILNKMLIPYTFSFIFHGAIWTLYICVFNYCMIIMVKVLQVG
jgi:hypothetical protein